MSSRPRGEILQYIGIRFLAFARNEHKQLIHQTRIRSTTSIIQITQKTVVERDFYHTFWAEYLLCVILKDTTLQIATESTFMLISALQQLAKNSYTY